MYYLKNKIVKVSSLISVLFLMSCESDPLPVSSSFLNDNSFMVETFTALEDVRVFQDEDISIGDSYRLYSGNINGINSTTYLKINTSLVRSSKYCQFDSNLDDGNSILSVDTVRLVLRTFTELEDSNDSLISLIDKNNLVIKGGFVNLYSWDEDSTKIFDNEISNTLNQNLTVINSELIEYDNYTIHVILPLADGSLLTDEWCEHDCFLGDYYISIDYNPIAEKEQYIEFLSSQNYYQSTTVFRPSLRFIYNELEDSIAYVNKWSFNEIDGATLNSSNMDFNTLDVYYVHNQSLETNSKILFANNIVEFDNDIYNNSNIYINDLNLQESNFSEGSYQLNLNYKLNQDIIDSISVIDFFIDSIKIISNDIDPSGDNSLEGNGNWDYIDINENQEYDEGEEHEYYYDLGVDNCPDNYEDPNNANLCLCNDYINDPDSCLDENMIYNPSGTEGNGEHDAGEVFPPQYDCGVDGLCDENEEGEGEDPAGDNYNIDPSNDNWRDYGSDGCPDEYETGDQNNPCNFNQVNNCLDNLYSNDCVADPNEDNWGYGNVENGTEGNGKWDIGEGFEGNGLWDCNDDGTICEPFIDLGIDGIPESQEQNCFYCNDDSTTEGNGLWDYLDQNDNGQYDIGENCEPFQDTGIDQIYTIYEEGYNPSGTEGNNFRDFGEEFPAEHDCGEDGLCDENEEGEGSDPAGDNYNIDPNNDNWSDCGSDGDCSIVDDNGTQNNGLWDNGEGVEGNSEYDNGEFFNDLGTDNLSDIIENLTSDTSLNYYIPQSISYDIFSSLDLDVGPENEVDSSKNIIFDIKSINYNEGNGLITLAIDITANTDFKALEFRLNHSPYLSNTSSQIHSKDLIHRINQDELFEDISIYDNSYLESDIFSNTDNLVLDYFNGIKFSFKFSELENWINDNSNVSINYNYTTLVLYVNHEDSNYNFFNGDANLWLSIGGNNRLLGVADAIPFSSLVGPLQASGEKQVLIPFGTIINEILEGDLDPNEDIVFMLDGGADNTSRIVFHGYSTSDNNESTINAYTPKLEVYYIE
tara:strand:- start:4944 stop:8054 length:3111 start_codon:yes stop_codon:yes gene_type:complete